jgi:hypothetical protein
MLGTITGERTTGVAGRKYVLDWKCDASGDANAYLDTDLSLGLITGTIEFIETAPGENGDLTTDLPTASYDLYIRDIHGYDWLGTALENRSVTVAEKVVPSPVPIVIAQQLRLIVDNAGDSKRGRVIIGVKSLL